MHRRMTIRSNPPGAFVYVDNQQVGTTPVSAEFLTYGTRKVQLIKGGYETLTVERNIQAPWYQIPPLDLISDNFWPWEIRDERVLDFQMVPTQVVPAGQVLQRAEALRQGARVGYVAPLPPRPPGAVGQLPIPGVNTPEPATPEAPSWTPSSPEQPIPADAPPPEVRFSPPVIQPRLEPVST